LVDDGRTLPLLMHDPVAPLLQIGADRSDANDILAFQAAVRKPVERLDERIRIARYREVARDVAEPLVLVADKIGISFLYEFQQSTQPLQPLTRAVNGTLTAFRRIAQKGFNGLDFFARNAPKLCFDGKGEIETIVHEKSAGRPRVASEAL